MAICPNCLSQIDDSAKFCNFCGTKLTASAEASRDVPETENLYTAPVSEPAAVPEPAAPAPDAPSTPPTEPAAMPLSAQTANPQQDEAVPPLQPAQPAQTAEQPAYSQPIYSQPIYPEQPKKKKKKWLIPVIIAAVLAVLALIGIIIGAGALVSKANNPYVGTYKATSVSMYGLDMDPDDIFEGGFVVELKPGGICHIQAGASEGTGTWKYEDDVLTVNDGTSAIEGKLEDDVITFENMLDMGLDIKLVKQEE